MKGRVGTSMSGMIQLSRNDIIRKLELEQKRRDHEAKYAGNRASKPIVHPVLDEVAARKRAREERRNQK